MPVYDNVQTFAYYPNPEQKVRKLYKHLNIESVLDVGAGHGGVFDKGHLDGLPLKRREACDIHWIRPTDGDWTLRLGVDAQRLTDFYPEKSFDMIQCMETLEHVENPRLALEQFIKVARKFIILSSCDEGHHHDDDVIVLNNPHQRYILQPSVKDMEELGYIVRVEHYDKRQLVAWRYIT